MVVLQVSLFRFDMDCADITLEASPVSCLARVCGKQVDFADIGGSVKLWFEDWPFAFAKLGSFASQKASIGLTGGPVGATGSMFDFFGLAAVGLSGQFETTPEFAYDQVATSTPIIRPTSSVDSSATPTGQRRENHNYSIPPASSATFR